MKRLVLIVWCVTSVAWCYFIGMRLAHFFLSLSFEIPSWLASLIRHGIRLVYHNYTPDALDIEDVCGILLMVAAYTIAVVAVSLVSVAAWRQGQGRWFVH